MKRLLSLAAAAGLALLATGPLAIAQNDTASSSGSNSGGGCSKRTASTNTSGTTTRASSATSAGGGATSSGTTTSPGNATGANDPLRGTAASKLPQVDLNNSSHEDLQTIPGVDTELANRIVRMRPYRQPEDLVTKRVMPDSLFRLVRSRIIVTPARPDSTP